jgi:hypothetical protein
VFRDNSAVTLGSEVFGEFSRGCKREQVWAEQIKKQLNTRNKEIKRALALIEDIRKNMKTSADQADDIAYRSARRSGEQGVATNVWCMNQCKHILDRLAAINALVRQEEAAAAAR